MFSVTDRGSLTQFVNPGFFIKFTVALFFFFIQAQERCTTVRDFSSPFIEPPATGHLQWSGAK
jgi:hypothetical protein